jgi:putative transposase
MNFRRYYVPGAAVFITQVVHERQPILADPRVLKLLRSTLQTVKEFHPFCMLAYVFLPDHIHLIIQPTGDSNFSQIMHSLKPNFTRSYKRLMGHEEPLKLWQKRFWDHVIREERDLENHLHYVHFNPVKHGYVSDPRQWLDSSYREWEARGLYQKEITWIEPKNSLWGE